MSASATGTSRNWCCTRSLCIHWGSEQTKELVARPQLVFGTASSSRYDPPFTRKRSDFGQSEQISMVGAACVTRKKAPHVRGDGADEYLPLHSVTQQMGVEADQGQDLPRGAEPPVGAVA